MSLRRPRSERALQIEPDTRKLARIRVRGVVQGVGFRPFIFRLAHEHDLTGWVRNTSSEVDIEVEGEEIDRFLVDLEDKAPPMALIERVTTTIHPPKGYTEFEIKDSLAQKSEYQLVSPDIATCRECQNEILSPDDRRYHYPFTNCTNCGPRFTIIEDIPYDRARTTMRHFVMCPDCQREYDDPLDRRFHAQPNACPRCGPHLTLVDNQGNPMICDDPIVTTAGLLKQGRIVAIKGLGGFLLVCDATNSQTVNLLRERKRRPGKPFAVMLPTLEEARRHCVVSREEETLLESCQCPIVLVEWRSDSAISPGVAPGIKYLGIMLPYTPLHHLLLREANLPLVMTSGNLSEEPIARDNDEALRRLIGIADYFLLHNRDIYSRYDDSVYIVEGGSPRAVRRARGYAPYPIFLPFTARRILACGAEEKNTFCLTRENHAFLSQHIGDMENAETLEQFENTIELYQRLFRIQPEVVAHDVHPDYLATKYALELAERQPDLKLVPVQHHHAHIVSCLIENGIAGPVIGVAFDGTGYGTDGTIWGGEFLIADWKGFERMGHLEYIPMPGGAAAIKKPYRMALSYLFSLGIAEGVPLLGRIEPTEVQLIRQQVERKINSPLTSSVGRLFDGVAALAGVRDEINYEAQAAIEMEMLAPKEVHNFGGYPFSITAHQGMRIVKLGELLAAVIDDIKNGVPVPLISARFHHTISEMIVEMCRVLARERGLSQVALSGGVFQNRLLLRLTTSALRAEGFSVLTHRLVPTNDGGISLGQAVVANFS
ncbi:MAG TPA: carbamoyltransferase HypF [Dehalococcoidia bacterium]|nr:carbamoyltransferase HypF [Dehalococcoidia bacterium]